MVDAPSTQLDAPRRNGLHDADALIIAGRTMRSRLLLGTGGFASLELLAQAIAASASRLVTVALRRIDADGDRKRRGSLIDVLDQAGVELLPNTAGCHTARDAVITARLAREAFATDWIKLEVIGDEHTLLPDAPELLLAAEQLVHDGFVVLPYTTDDPVLARRLADVGCAAVMPLGSPIGSNRGLETRAQIQIIIEQSGIPVVVDAGIGVPSHAAEAMEIGASAVLVNTAIAIAADPVRMARAFRKAVEAGREAWDIGLPAPAITASPTSPLTAFLG